MIDRVFGLLTLVVILAMVAVIFSKRATTAKVLSSGLSGFSGLIKAAASPVTSVK